MVPLKSSIENRLNRMDGHFREVLGGASTAFFFRIIGAGAAFALNVVIGRLLGAEGAGLYFLALSVAMFASIIARLGLDSSLLRFIAAAAAKEDWGQVQGVFLQGIKIAGIASVVLALAIALAAPWSAKFIFGKPELAPSLVWMSLAVISFSMMSLLAESLKGLKLIGRSMLVTGVIYPFVALVLIWPLVGLAGVAGASLAYVIATMVAALTGAFWWRREMRQGVVPAPISRGQLWQSARPLLVMNIITRGIIPMAPLLLVGIWGSTEDAGLFGAATRLAMLASFFLAAVNTAIAPKISELYIKGDMETLGRVIRRFALGITLATSPLFLLLFVASDWVMGLFGPEFTRGGTALAILAVGQLVNAMTGSVGILLIMSGHERDIRNASIFAMALVIILALVLTPAYGLTGAAISAAAAMIGMNLYSTLLVRKRLRISVFQF